MTQREQDKLMKDMGVDERLGSTVPLDISVTDERGATAPLNSYFLHKRPVLLSLNYYGCPMLCPITFGNLAQTMRDMKGLRPGRDFDVVTVSINPDETPKDAAERSRETYAGMQGFDDPSRWWSFLLSSQPGIDALTKSVGFRYVRTDKANFAHPSVLVVLTQDGRVSRYLYGVKQQPNDLRLALVEASGGRIGASTALNRVLLYCYHYDPVGKRYAIVALNVMKIMGGFVLGMMALLAMFMWRAERGRKDV